MEGTDEQWKAFTALLYISTIALTVVVQLVNQPASMFLSDAGNLI
jgi:hypothetical protein